MNRASDLYCPYVYRGDATMPEEWRNVPGFEGYYLVSSCGRVFSTRSEKILKQRHNLGYMRVNLSVNGKIEQWSVHRLVALAFIPNPENKPTVNHINEIKDDNRVENLEWATIREQNIHGTRLQRARLHTNYKARKIDYAVVASKHNYRAMGDKFSKSISQYDGEKHVKTYQSLRKASKETGISISHICACLKGRYKTAGGWIWKYAN